MFEGEDKPWHPLPRADEGRQRTGTSPNWTAAQRLWYRRTQTGLVGLRAEIVCAARAQACRILRQRARPHQRVRGVHGGGLPSGGPWNEPIRRFSPGVRQGKAARAWGCASCWRPLPHPRSALRAPRLPLIFGFSFFVPSQARPASLNPRNPRLSAAMRGARPMTVVARLCAVHMAQGWLVRLVRLPPTSRLRWADWLHHPCLLGGPQSKGTTSEVATSPLPSRGSPIEGDHIRSGYITPAFSGVPNRRGPHQKWLHHPCLLRGPQSKGTTSEVATSPLPSRGSPIEGDHIRLFGEGGKIRHGRGMVKKKKIPCALTHLRGRPTEHTAQHCGVCSAASPSCPPRARGPLPQAVQGPEPGCSWDGRSGWPPPVRSRGGTPSTEGTVPVRPHCDLGRGSEATQAEGRSGLKSGKRFSQGGGA